MTRLLSARSTVVAALSLLLLPAALAAQSPSPWEFGLVVGVGRSSVVGAGPVDARLGPLAGVFGTYRVSSVVSLRAEPAFSQVAVQEQLCSIAGCALGAVGRATRLSYVELPLVVQVAPRFAPLGVRPFAYGGPYVGMRLACRQAETTGAVAFDQTAVATADVVAATYPCGSSFTSAQTGVLVGAGVSTRGAAVSLRWNRGFTSLARPILLDGGTGLVNGRASRLALVVELTPSLGRRTR